MSAARGGSKFLSSLLLLLMTKITCSSTPPPSSSSSSSSFPVQQAAESQTEATSTENSSSVGTMSTRRRRKHRKKARNMNKTQDAMKFICRVTFDLVSALRQHKSSSTAINVYIPHPKRHQTVLFTCVLLATLTFASSPVGASIDCFKCVSMNGNNPACEDPFHNNFSSSILETPCMGGRKGRNGLFPATACIKMKGIYWDNGETFIVRGCALDSGTQTTDTEIIRMSHCGGYYYNDRYVRGCLQSCDDADGCNGTTTTTLFSMDVSMLSQLTLSIILWYWYFMSFQLF